MQWYALTLGARNTPAAGRKFSRRDDALIRRITRKHFPDGFTIVEAKGGWWDSSGTRFVREESRQIQVGTRALATVRRWARELGAALGQSELIVLKLGSGVSLKVARRRSPQA